MGWPTGSASPRAEGDGLLHDAAHVDRLSCGLAGVRTLVRRRHLGAPRRLPRGLVRRAVPAVPARQRRTRRAARAAGAGDGHADAGRARPAGHADPLALRVGGRAGQAPGPRPGGRARARVHVRALRRRGTAGRCVRRRTSRSRCASPSLPTWPRCTTGCTASRVRSRWPGVVAVVSSTPPSWTPSPPTPRRSSRRPDDDPWDRALSRSPPTPRPALDDARLDALLTAIGDFVDLKCPFTLGHSRDVAALAASGRRTSRAPCRRGDRGSSRRPPPRRRADRGVRTRSGRSPPS